VNSISWPVPYREPIWLCGNRRTARHLPQLSCIGLGDGRILSTCTRTLELLSLSLGMLLYVLGPTGLGGLNRDFPACPRGHGLQSPLPADLTAFAAHSGHDAGYLGRGHLGGTRLWRVRGGRPPDHLESRLAYVPAQSLWHGYSMPRLRRLEQSLWILK